MMFKKLQSGFSIMEVIAVLAIISIGLLGVVTLVIQNIQVQFVNKNALIASQLAQEGLELVKAKRDSNWLQGKIWNTDLGTGNYIIDAAAGTWQSGIPNIDDPQTKLYYRVASGDYVHIVPGMELTNFRRLIVITYAPGNYMIVKCIVQYSSMSNKYQYVAEMELYNWGER